MANSPFKQQAARRRRLNRLTDQRQRPAIRASKQDEHDQRIREENTLVNVTNAAWDRVTYASNFCHNLWLQRLLQ